MAQFLKGSPLTKATTIGFAAGVATAVARGGKIEITQIAADAFGNALGQSLAHENWGGSDDHSGNANDDSSPGRNVFDQAREQLNKTYYPEATLTEEAYAKRDHLADLGIISRNTGPQMSIPSAAGEGDLNGDYITLRGFNALATSDHAAMAGLEATYHRFAEGNTNAYALGITDAQVEANIANGARGTWDAVSYAGRKTAYATWNFVTAGFVERHDGRIRAEANGLLSSSNFWRATALDATTSVASMAIAGRVGGFVANRAGSGYFAYSLAGAAAGGSFDLTYQASQNAIHLATDGQSGQYGFAGREFGDSVVYGAGLGVAGKFLSEYGQHSIRLSLDVDNALYSGGPLPFKLVPPDKFNYGAYLKNLIGGPPEGMIDPHAHHILFKQGNGSTQKALVREGQDLLRRYEIDPIYGPENLTWAPNRVQGQHGEEALRNVVDQLKQVEQFGGSRADVVKQLERLGQLAAQRK
ncbi:AHH domain-containing protein [Pseudoduganella chitinolytica]|uniref:AHH domain-containing protein n=1 Tax=Pseudoduganella chitinolytica TaxID=34070 RepID=A0ABY8BB04_9BURK|nr:AHH domain-containing protein [Pseudoduganella chitinolytica]WEF32876.1 AHH domain-containing protein [Pseudoduganella chitinolytica]